MNSTSIALMIYGEPGSQRNAITEEKYRKLANYFIEKGLNIHSVLYHDSVCKRLENELQKFAAVLVWVNPIEQGNSRKLLDELLMRLSTGRFVSAHPGTILKMGTKEVLFKLKDTEFGGDVKRYDSFEDFKERFPGQSQDTRILKQYRGNGGSGVFKVDLKGRKNGKVCITHATKGDEEIQLTNEEFYASFKTYFNSGSMLIDQAWNPGIVKGMVRCYLSGAKVSGFGYQEINALYPVINGVYKKPSQRYNYTED